MSTHPSASTRARRRHRRAVAAIGIVVLMIAATACFSLDPKSGSGNGMAYITDVRSARQGDTDRVVIEFANKQLPNWDVRLATPPFYQDGSGKKVKVSGHAFLAVKLTHADAHSWFVGPTRFSPPGTPNVTEIVRNGDFEGHVNHVIGLENMAAFQVTVLKSPSRLVIDIQH